MRHAIPCVCHKNCAIRSVRGGGAVKELDLTGRPVLWSVCRNLAKRAPLGTIPDTMKITIERAALLRALGHVQSVVERRNTIPILSNVRMRAESGRLSLSATGLSRLRRRALRARPFRLPSLARR